MNIDEQYEKRKSLSYLVVKDNRLVQNARFNLTATQQRFLAYVISKVKPTDEIFTEYTIRVDDFCKLCGIDKTWFYSEFISLVEDFDNRSFWVETSNELYKFRWFDETSYQKGKGTINIILSKRLREYLIGLSKNFTQYELYNIMALKSKSFNVDAVLDNYIVAKNAGLKLSVDDIESHILAGGNIGNVIKAMIAAKNANIKLPFHIAKVIDLSGRDVCSVVQSCIVPKIVETSVVSSVSKDGIELKASASITIKANLGRVLGGADEGTIVSRVSEALSATIGSSVSHKAVLENPDVISDVIFNKGLDSGTAYEIISIDIFDRGECLDISIGDFRNGVVSASKAQGERMEVSG